jgi:hypothetical protein
MWWSPNGEKVRVGEKSPRALSHAPGSGRRARGPELENAGEVPDPGRGPDGRPDDSLGIAQSAVWSALRRPHIDLEHQGDERHQKVERLPLAAPPKPHVRHAATISISTPLGKLPEGRVSVTG